MKGLGKGAVVLSLVLIFSMCIYGVFATHTLSSYSVSTTGGDLLTPNNVQETFNFSVTSNTSSSHSIVEINISNVNFTILNTSYFNESCSISAWSYYNFSDYVVFNTSSGNISNGSSCWFAFNATPGISEIGDNVSQNWTVKTTDNNTDTVNTYLLTYIDSLAPVVNRINLTYGGTNVAGGNITERKNITIEANVTDYGYGVNSSDVIANITNSSGKVVNELALANAGGDVYSGVWEAATNNTGSGKYSINISVSDLGGNSNSSANSTTLTLNAAPDFTVTNLTWNSSNANPMHPSSSDNITINATLKNLGDGNATGNITVSIYLNGVLKVNNTVSNESLETGETNYTAFTLESGNFSPNTEYNFTVKIDPFNSIEETFENNNTDSLNLSVGYNVTIISLEYNETVYSPPYLKSNESFSINVSVRYANGDPVTGLSEANFTHVYDNYGGGSAERDWGASSYQGTSLDNFTSTMNSSGVYWFDIVTSYHQTEPKPGVHNLTVTAENGSYSGSSAGLDYYFLLAPSFTVSFSSLLTEISEEYSDSFSVLATNTGNATLYSTVAVIKDTHDYLTFTSCSGSINLTNSSSPQTICSSTMTSSAVTSDQNGCFQANVSGKSNGLLFYTLSTLQCLDVLNVVTGDGTPGGTPGTGCTTDADCSTGYYCSAGTCVKKAYSISITNYASSLQVNWSSHVTTKITVKNDGSNAFTAKLTVTLSGFDVTVLPSSMTLNPGNAIMFTVNISAPETVSIGSHSGTFKAYVDEDTTVYQTKSFSITVLTTPEKKSEVNETYHNYSAILDGLKERFQRLKAIGFINQTDLDEVDSLLNSSSDDLELVKSALDEEDYEEADSILALLNASLSSIETKIEGLELEQQEGMGGELSGVWFWVVIGIVVVIVVVFLVYLLMPSGGYRPSSGYKPVIKEGFFERLGKRFGRKKKAKWKPEKPSETGPERPAYREGYEKVTPGYRYETGAKRKVKDRFGRIKKKLKRKKPQKEVSDYFG